MRARAILLVAAWFVAQQDAAALALLACAMCAAVNISDELNRNRETIMSSKNKVRAASVARCAGTSVTRHRLLDRPGRCAIMPRHPLAFFAKWHGARREES